MHLTNLGEGTSRRLFRLPGKSYGQRRLAWTQHFLWNPALHLLRPSRLHLHRRLNSWSKRSARQTGEHGRPIPFRPCNMLSRLSDQRNSLLVDSVPIKFRASEFLTILRRTSLGGLPGHRPSSLCQLPKPILAKPTLGIFPDVGQLWATDFGQTKFGQN